MENDKQLQRNRINEAVKDFLARGGTIKKLDPKTAEVDGNLTLHSEEYVNISDMQAMDSSNFMPFPLRFEFDEQS